MNTYFSDVFPVAAVTGRMGVNLHSLENVYDAFQQYLTSKGYKFKPSGVASCDFATDESAAKAAKHRRAYEGNPCSNCGKVVETGWKYSAQKP